MNLVQGRKEGRKKLYRLQPELLQEVKEWLSFYEQFWNNRLSILKHIVENDGEDDALKVIRNDGSMDKEE